MSEFGQAIDEARAEYGAAMADFKPDTCTISVPPVATGDSWGESSAGDPTTTASVPCDYRPLSARERYTGTQVEGLVDYELSLPATWQGAVLNVPPRSAIVVDARPPNPARTFQVDGPLPSSSGMELKIAAALKQ